MKIQVLSGAPIYTMDASGETAGAVVIADGRIERVAEHRDEALSLYPGAELIEVSGGCILPGFVDAHLHLKKFSLLFRDIDLSDFRSEEELLGSLEKTASKKKAHEWLVAGGLENALLERLSARQLDAASRSVPVLLYSRDLHSALVNSSALARAGIDESRGDPYAGKIERAGDGFLSGILRERAVELVSRVVPEEKPRKVEAFLERGIKKLVSAGITTFCDCSTGTGETVFRNLARIWKKGRLKARAVIMMGERDARVLEELGLPSAFGNSRLMIGGLKVMLDGSLSSLTAYMSKPYRGSESLGMLLVTEEELQSLLRGACGSYLWGAVHCIGDRANEIALNVFEKLARDRSVPKLLRRIEHAQSLKDADIQRMSRLGVIAVVNPAHIPMDRERAIKLLGAEAGLLHRLGSLKEAGAVLAFSSDAPVAPVNPFYGLYCAVERRSFGEGPELRFYPKEKIALEDAVRAYTTGGAHACGLGGKVGSIEPGKYADLIHVSKDIFAEGTEALEQTEVLKTIIEGEIIFDKK